MARITATSAGICATKITVAGYAGLKLLGYSFEEGSNAGPAINNFANNYVSPAIGLSVGITLDGVVTKLENCIPKQLGGFLEMAAVGAMLVGAHYCHDFTGSIMGDNASANDFVSVVKEVFTNIYYSGLAVVKGDIGLVEPHYAAALYMTARAVGKVCRNVLSGLKKIAENISHKAEQAEQRRKAEAGMQ